MKIYQPQCKVSLVKIRSRTVVSGSLPAVAARYKERVLDLTPYLSDGGIRLHKGVREPAGAFSVSLTARPHEDMLETLDNLIEPMDMVEIRLAHEPPGPKDNRADWPPVVMRGFVSQVARSESIANGSPQRSIVISGQDYGKLWQILQIFYLNNSVVGDNILTELKFFQKYLDDGSARNMAASDFAALVLEKVLNPYLLKVTELADEKGGMPKSIKSKVSVEGVVAPFGPGHASDMSVHQLLSQFLDVGHFNEMYIEDVGPDVVLVIRPQPALDGSGKPYDASDPVLEKVEIGLGDVVSTQLSRSDSGVFNIFEVENTAATVIGGVVYKSLAMSDGAGSPIAHMDELNQESKFFGIRRLGVNTTLNNPSLISVTTDKKEGQAQETGEVLQWLSKRRERLFLINRDASVFERGSLRIKGNEKLRAGMCLLVRHSSALTVSYYVPSVSHEFVPGSGFFTTAQVERGNGFVLSAGIAQAPEMARRDLGGVK